MRYIVVLHCLAFLLLFGYAAYGCTFPSDLTGQWYSSTKGVLSLTTDGGNTVIESYPTTRFGNIRLTCNVSSGSNYVFQSDAFSYLGLQFEVYLCFFLSSQISSSKFIYYLNSVENTDANDERLKAFIQNSVTVTTTNVCDRTSYTTGAVNIFLKNDGNEADAKITCPSIWEGTWNYVFTSGSTDYCASDSSVDVCSTPDTSTVVYNYTTCNTVQAYSATGTLYCMYYVTDDSYTYLYVYNTDTSTDESTTYRFTCYVMASSNSSTVLATQYPQECQSGQTATNVSTPGALLVYTLNALASVTTSDNVVSTAATAGVIVGILILIIIVICGVLIWYYYKKRKEKERIDKMPLQKAQPANKKLVNGGIFKDVKHRQPSRNSKTPGTLAGTLTPVFTNGDVKVNIDEDPGIRRENSICISVQSRGGTGFGELERKAGPVPVEEPFKVNEILDEPIVEHDNEVTLASTFLPMSPHETNILNYTDDDIKAIEKLDKLHLEDMEHDAVDMDRVDDELGLPRLSGAFTPVTRPVEIPTLPPISFRKNADADVVEESGEERTAAGIVKVKLKKQKKKKRVTSSKANLKGSPSKSPTKMPECPKGSTPFLDRIKKVEIEKAELEQKEHTEKEIKRAESEMKQARPIEEPKEADPAPSSKYLVDNSRSKSIQSANKGVVQSATGTHRRRFGDPPGDSARKNRRKTAILRHPMEIEGDTPERGGQAERLEKKEVFWKEEKRQRSGRRREHPEARTIPSVREDPFDYRDNPGSSAVASTRFDRSANGLRMERENSTFIDPPKEEKAGTDVWKKATNMLLFKNTHAWGNLTYH